MNRLHPLARQIEFVLICLFALRLSLLVRMALLLQTALARFILIAQPASMCNFKVPYIPIGGAPHYWAGPILLVTLSLCQCMLELYPMALIYRLREACSRRSKGQLSEVLLKLLLAPAVFGFSSVFPQICYRNQV